MAAASHTCTADNAHAGYFIPEGGTTILGNAWCGSLSSQLTPSEILTLQVDISLNLKTPSRPFPQKWTARPKRNGSVSNDDWFFQPSTERARYYGICPGPYSRLFSFVHSVLSIYAVLNSGQAQHGTRVAFVRRVMHLVCMNLLDVSSQLASLKHCRGYCDILTSEEDLPTVALRRGCGC